MAKRVPRRFLSEFTEYYNGVVNKDTNIASEVDLLMAANNTLRWTMWATMYADSVSISFATQRHATQRAAVMETRL